VHKLPIKATSQVRIRSPRVTRPSIPPPQVMPLAPIGAPSPGATARASTIRLLRFADVRDRTGLSRSTIWRLERRGEFPAHRRISANTVAWVEEEVAAWIHTKIGRVAV
jgi:prophage regulatory protein